MKKGSFSLMKKTNQRLVLRIIQKEGQVSRSGLVEKTGLVPATVSGRGLFYRAGVGDCRNKSNPA